MVAASFLDACKFSPTTGGTTDWTFSSAVTGYSTPGQAGVVNGATYRYRAESADLTQWEVGTGTYNTGTGVLTRTTVLYNSSATGTGSGQSGAGTKINFSTLPTVGIVLTAEDLATFLTYQGPTQQIFTSGSGTYTTPAGVKWIRVRLIGGGGGGGGAGSGVATAAGTGGATTFGTSLLSGGGGARGGDLSNAAGGAAAATLGSGPVGFAVNGTSGGPAITSLTTLAELGTPATGTQFGGGAVSVNGGSAQSGTANTGGGGAGGASTASSALPGGCGGSGGYVDAKILSPSATYSYAVGAAGTAGSNAANGFGGGAGGSGFIIVEEFYY